jgi:predicted MPP superfamily phosphohydrolase
MLLVPCIALTVIIGFFSALGFVFYALALHVPALAIYANVRGPASGVRRSWSVAALGLVSTCVAAYALFVEPNRLQIAEHELALPQWPPGSPPARIVQISDIQTVGPCERQDRAAAMINALHPDLIVICGDYVAGPYFDPEPAIAAAHEFIGSLHAPLGIVCVKGHSEHEADRVRVFEGLGVRYLKDEEFELDLGEGRRLRVIGLDLDGPHFQPRRENGLATLVVSHVPDVSWNLDGLGVDVHLAGHTHGGQICIPGYGAPITLSRLPHEYARGLFRFGDHWLNVTPGVGMEGGHAPRVRLFCPPQIDLIVLRGGGEPAARVEPPER